MGHKLHRLGEYAYRHGWQVVGIWVLITAILGLLAVKFMQPTSSAISIPGTQAQQALDRMGELFPDAGKGSGRVVFAAPDGKQIADYKDRIDQLGADLAQIEGVSGAVSPFKNPAAISRDGTVAYMQVQLEQAGGSVEEATIDAVVKKANAARTDGLTVEMGGDIVSSVPGEILGVGEVAGVILALVVLVVTLGSLVAAGLPIIVALLTIGVSMAGLFALSEVMNISATTPVLAVMLGLAVGIDYSLFIVSKYRGYLLEGYPAQEAAGRAIGTAGNAVIFAAMTVVIALAALAIVQIPFMTTMGLAGAATVALAAIVAVTLLPALLGLVGGRAFGGKTRRAIEKAAARGPKTARLSHSTFWYRWGEFIVRRPLLVLTVTLLLVIGVGLPAKDLRLGLPTDEYASAESTKKKAYDLLARGFGVGFNAPLAVVVEGLPAVTEADREAVRAPLVAQMNQQIAEETAKAQQQMAARMAAATTPQELQGLQQEGVAMQAAGEAQRSQAVAQIEAAVQQYAPMVQLQRVAKEITKLDNVAQVQPALANADGTAGLIQVIPAKAPSDVATGQLIDGLRDARRHTELAGAGATLAVTGATALERDINAKLAAALPQYLVVVVGLSLVLLIVAFRSILVPLKATLGFLLSVFAMFGAMVAVFQLGWFGIADAPGPLVSFIPIIAIGILFGLAMDYEFFLVSSMHEAYAHGASPKQAVVNGFGLGNKVVTAAGVIMVAVFAGFVTNHDSTIQTIGFGLAVGIFVDAFIVRMLMVPAVMALLGRYAWWLPKWLDRIVPRVSIEGEAAKSSR